MAIGPFTKMNWQNKLVDANPRLFGAPAWAYPECNDRWRKLLKRCCSRIESALQPDETLTTKQIKEKYATLRFYTMANFRRRSGRRSIMRYLSRGPAAPSPAKFAGPRGSQCDDHPTDSTGGPGRHSKCLPCSPVGMTETTPSVAGVLPLEKRHRLRIAIPPHTSCKKGCSVPARTLISRPPNKWRPQ
ncbi:hypothetical protein ABIF70_002931 [Bradyrhizobium japonicum]